MDTNSVKNEYESLTAFRHHSSHLKIMREIASKSNDRSETSEKIKSIIEGIDNATTFARALVFTEVSYGNSNRNITNAVIFFARYVDDFAKFAYHEKQFRNELLSQIDQLTKENHLRLH